jgi:protein-disulfide isomerase
MTMSKRQFGKLALAAMVSALILRMTPAFSQVEGEAAAMAKSLMEAVPPHGERTLGDPKAPVTMIEYASATCSHCAEFHMKVWPSIKEDYVDKGKALFVLREFPTDQLALGAFMLARCVPQDKYFEAIDMLFLQQKFWTKNPKLELFKIVGDLGLSEADAEACIKKQDLATSIKGVLDKANKDFGVKGTPTFFVNGSLLDGHEDPASVRKGIDAELAKLGLQ